MTMDRYAGSVRRTSPQSWNRYAYVENDPVNNNDPSGACNSEDPLDLDCWFDWGVDYFTFDFQISILGLPTGPCWGGPDSKKPIPNPGCFGWVLNLIPLTRALDQSLPDPQCTIALKYRPVSNDPKSVLNKYNHSYLDVSFTFNGVTEAEVIEGLPQNSVPIGNNWGNLTANVFDIGPTGNVIGDSQDNPASDPTVGKALSGGQDVCDKILQLLGAAGQFPKNIPYNPIPGNPFTASFPGANSNFFAWSLLQGVGLNFGAPPQAPGFPGSVVNWVLP